MNIMYYVASPEEDRELAYLEATVLLEEKVETPFHFSQHIVDISRSAYVKLCGIVVLKANSFVELIEKITEADFDFDQFRIEIHSSIRIRKDLPSQSKGVIEVADAIKRGNPNLNNPIISLDVLADENGVDAALTLLAARQFLILVGEGVVKFDVGGLREEAFGWEGGDIDDAESVEGVGVGEYLGARGMAILQEYNLLTQFKHLIND